MRTSPSIVPHEADQDTYLVMDDFGRLGCAWRETDTETADRETLIRHLIKGEYNKSKNKALDRLKPPCALLALKRPIYENKATHKRTAYITANVLHLTIYLLWRLE